MEERKIKVKKINTITPNMLRITFSGNDLRNFPENEIGGYIKLVFKELSSNKKFVRPFTIRDFRIKKLELDIDFALHEKNQGLASNWANNAQLGDEINFTGPKGQKRMVNKDSDWFFLIGDMSSLPAISVNIETLPKKARGMAIIEVMSEYDKQMIKKPQDFKIKWVINSQPSIKNTKLIDEVRSFEWYDGSPSIWVACEFSNMRALRKYFFEENQVDKEQIYISSYWKIGLDQESHKVIKKKDSAMFAK